MVTSKIIEQTTKNHHRAGLATLVNVCFHFSFSGSIKNGSTLSVQLAWSSIDLYKKRVMMCETLGPFEARVLENWSIEFI